MLSATFLAPFLFFVCSEISTIAFALSLPNFYPFGEDVGDHVNPANDDGGSGEVEILVPFPFFGEAHNSLFVNTNGVISFLINVNQYTPERFPLDDGRRVVAPFWGDADTRTTGKVFYRETFDRNLLMKAATDITSIYVECKAFRPAWLMIATWYEVPFYGARGNYTDRNNTFQAVLATNGMYSFVLFNYNKLTWTTGTASQGNSSGLGGIPAQAGYNAGDGLRFFNIPGSGTHEVLNLPYTSNIERPGRWMYRVDSKPGGCGNGTGIPCPYGQVRDPNSEQCYDAPIQFDTAYLQEPSISYVPLPHVDGTDTIGEITDIEINVTLKCEVHFNRNVQSWKNVTYLVEWYSEDVYLKRDHPCGTLPPDKIEYDSSCLEPHRPLVSYLSSTDYDLNRLISCKVFAKYTTSPLNPWSIPKTVPKPFFAGIKIFPSQLTLKACNLDNRNTTTTITIQPTIPVRRGHRGGYLNIAFWLPEGLSINHEHCAIGVEGTNEVFVDVIAQCADFGETMRKVIVPEILDFHSIFWTSWSSKKFHLPKILVESSAAKIDECLAYLDPHYHSFRATLSDGNLGQRYHYAFMGHGDFILYSNTELKFEVHTRHWTCGFSRTCNCGVVLRDRNDVIEFNCCNEYLDYDQVTPIRVRVRSKKRLAPGISIRQTLTGFNSEYRVEFPSGMQVKIFRVSYGLEVNVKGPRAEHVNNETGLCLYKGQQNITEFGYHFRLEPQESYFERLPELVDDKFEKPCSCFKTDTNGNPTCGPAVMVNYPNEVDKPGTLVNPEGSEGELRKRSTEYVDDITDRDFDSFKRYVASVVSKRVRRSSQTKSPFTKQNATEYCMERLFNSEVGSLCSQIGADVLELVASCSTDLEATGDTTYATSAVSLMINQCGGIVGRNLSSNINESSEEEQKDPSFLTNIIKKLCPNDCTFNGECVNGSCICNKEFTAEDCAVSIYQRPDISMLQENGLCDRRKRPCRKVTVMGTGFLNSTNMTCHIVEFMVINGSWTPNKTEIRLPGVMTDLILAECQLPESPVMAGHFHEGNEGTPAAGLLISMSNDGDHKSAKNLSFISYDSACMNCSISSGCFLKENSCFINRYCFAANEPNPLDLCYQCLPNVSSNTWTKRLVNFPPVFSSTTQYYALFQETLELAIDVSDPEGLPVTVSLQENSNEAVVHQNILRWNVSSDSSTHFSLKATDSCQASATLNITVNLVDCQCKNGSCVPHPNKPRGSGFYECNCLPGFTGSKCETNIDDCQSSPCLRGRCIDEVNKFRCICDPGYVGRRCETDFDDCSSSPCVHGTCTDFTGAYRCSCDSGYGGENCNINIDDCQSSPCIHGRCVDRVNNFTCICDVGFTGEKCNFDIDDCLQAICGNGTCVDSVNNYSCQCNAGFTGRNCGVRITNCSAESCYPNVSCFESNQGIYCGSCPLGLTGDGKNCRDIDYCTNATCNNGGSCVDGLSNYSCSCVAGFTGIHCETDIDYCTNVTCNNGGSCVDGLSNYSCSCVAGYTGIHCETDIDYCFNSTCNNGGSCIDGMRNYSCSCVAGFTGIHCETDIDDCVNHTCLNGGSCVDNVNNYSCVCETGFTGNYCQIDIDYCLNSTCNNGGSCIDGMSNYSCSCVAGFTGIHCETGLVQPTATTYLPARLSSSSVANVDPTLTPPSKETEMTAHAFKIRISNEDWSEDLRDNKSFVFKNLSARLERELMKALSAQEDLVGVNVLSFSKGSVVAEFQLMFRTSVLVDDVFEALKSKISDGDLGSLRVDPKSLERINPPTQEPSNDNDEKELGFPIIIGISCGGAFVLLLVIIVLINRYKKRKVSRPRIQPSLGAEFELTKPKSKENVWDKDVEGTVNDAYNY